MHKTQFRSSWKQYTCSSIPILNFLSQNIYTVGKPGINLIRDTLGMPQKLIQANFMP